MATSREALIAEFERRPFWRTLSLFDWLWGALLVGVAAGVLWVYGAQLDHYEIGTLIGSALGLTWLGWYWKPLRLFAVSVGAVALLAIWLYGGDLAAAEESFLLNYLLASQSAVMWMSALFLLATVVYFSGLFANSDFLNQTGSALTWTASAMGFIGLLVRWRETHLVSPEIGYFPVSNLYEVFILFAALTALIYLYYQQRYQTYAMGGFATLVISASILFLLWYTFDRQGHQIEPLVPALQSWWMKIHVPANFVGYGSFGLAAMVGIAYLLRSRAEARKPDGLLATRLPSRGMLDDAMYKIIALGFGFFTIATILGALWAAEAWGAYWQWDPKETWALIVWLNYAGWLHMRLTKGWRGNVMAWWALIGLAVTTFAFLGVNMFLSGLHSYGEL